MSFPAPADYTHLESLLLFQSILTQGVDNAAFGRISEQLKNNGLVKGDEKYDSTRLSPQALQHLFLRLFSDELRGETGSPVGDAPASNATPANATAPGTTATPTSPNSKKRKLAGPPLPTLRDVYDNLQKIPTLVNRLYARYREDVIQKIQADENNFDTVQKAIQVIEKNEKLRLAKNAAAGAAPSGPQNGAPPLAPRELKPAVLPSQPQVGAKRTSTTPIVPPKPPTPSIAPPGQYPQGGPALARPSSTGVPANRASPVLQPPPAAPHQVPSSGVLQAPIQPPPVSISPRPDAANQSKPPSGTPQPIPGQGQVQLKWANQYQPPVPVQATPSRQYQSPGPPKTPVAQQPPRPSQGPQPQQQQQQQQPSLQRPGPPGQPVQLPQQAQPIQPAQPPLVSQPPPSNLQQSSKPVLAPPQPQHAANLMPQMVPQPPTQQPVMASPSPQPRPAGNLPLPSGQSPHHRPIQPQQPQTKQPVPIAASISPSPGPSGMVAPPQKFAPPASQKRQLSPQQTQVPGTPTPGTPTPASMQKNIAPYGSQSTRPPIPEHMIRQAAAGTPLAPRRSSSMSTAPQTPTHATPQSTLLRGLRTTWGHQSTPSTPGPAAVPVDLQSPAYDPLSPTLKPATLPQPTPVIKKPAAAKPTPSTETRPTSARGGRGRGRGGGYRGRRLSATPSTGPARRSQSVVSQTDELSLDHVKTTTEVKNEEATPRPHEETGDTTADESVSGRGGNVATPGSMRILKRKRPETPTEPADPSGAPTHVVWTRGFTKVSSSALDQISSHRDANMFANSVRERDAPNYRGIVLQPQDITAIRSAIKQGNKAAVAAAASLPGGDPGTASVWLPISEDLVPPKGIVNSAQLERELVHMFSNAIMYNPDPFRGPGPAFKARPEGASGDEEGVPGYQVDTHGVVKNTRSMFVEVEKLLGDLRSAEKQRTGGGRPLSTPRVTSTAATPAADDTADDEDELAGDGEDGSGPLKRRRTRG